MNDPTLDSSALIAYFLGEEGGEEVNQLLQDAQKSCFAHVVNLCEFYYDIIRRSDITTARQSVRELYAAGVIPRFDMDEAFWQSVGELKINGKIALGDCFCIALALRTGGDVVTSDHKEFDVIAQQGICSVHFIR